MNTDPAERAKWRPISEYYDEMGPVVVIDIHDPGGRGPTISRLRPIGWTHFAELPLLTNEMADDLLAEMQRGEGGSK